MVSWLLGELKQRKTMQIWTNKWFINDRHTQKKNIENIIERCEVEMHTPLKL